MTTVLRGELALTMDPDLGVLRDPEIVIEDGRIASVRSRRDEEAAESPGTGEPAEVPGPDTTVMDLPGRWFLPGLVNAHTHAAMTLLRGFADDLPLRRWLEERIWPVERHLDEDDVHAGTLLATAELLAAGVTTMADMYLHMDGAAEAVRTSGIRAVVSPGLFEALGPTAEILDEAAAFARRWHGSADGRIRVQLAPHAIYTCPEELLREIVAVARDLDVGLHIHLSETREEVDRVRQEWGRSPVEVAADVGILEAGCLAAHCVWVDEGDIRLLEEAGAGVAHNPRSNMKLASGVAPIPRLTAGPLAVGLGTDGAASTNQLTLFEEMRAATMLQKVESGDPTTLPADAVLEMATLGGARAVGLGDEIGSLTPGKRADLIALRLERAGHWPVHDPLSTVVYSVQDQDVEWVFCDGRPVAHDGVPLAFSLEEARRDTGRRARELVARAGR